MEYFSFSSLDFSDFACFPYQSKMIRPKYINATRTFVDYKQREPVKIRPAEERKMAGGLIGALEDLRSLLKSHKPKEPPVSGCATWDPPTVDPSPPGHWTPMGATVCIVLDSRPPWGPLSVLFRIVDPHWNFLSFRWGSTVRWLGGQCPTCIRQ